DHTAVHILFYSSRRLHTRSKRDWSSDVCSSDLVTALSARVPDPHGYGRIVRDTSGAFTEIVEHADADPEQHKIDEINSGMYAFDGALLSRGGETLSSDNAKGD